MDVYPLKQAAFPPPPLSSTNPRGMQFETQLCAVAAPGVSLLPKLKRIMQQLNPPTLILPQSSCVHLHCSAQFLIRGQAKCKHQLCSVQATCLTRPSTSHLQVMTCLFAGSSLTPRGRYLHDGFVQVSSSVVLYFANLEGLGMEVWSDTCSKAFQES